MHWGKRGPREKFLPCIAFLKGTDPSCAALQPALIVGADSERLLYFRSGAQAPETANLRDHVQAFEPALLLVAPVDSAPVAGGSEDGAQDKAAKFGFRWFYPELLKHRHIWRDVLVASLAIQLMGLAMPLFTQVVIDKVVVHQTQSTLVVIGVGLAMFMLFSAVMTWLRQYLVLHTGNRIDAVLGAQVF